ncbi:anthocyanidin 3-O-glucosyltransferase 6 [Eucalyptus grandis]|uniref:anthocyanidin 3-O-glucosyltransferase 6 n=1 Tax=Eucalyptus grandis TaxID=71139 RepID=UPI00192E9179|nr:anthocyanidin 3-O-glucosyltransferase 6 [Eucalyptus grandis]
MAYGELVFIPTPGMGHLVSMVEMAKLLVHHDPQLSETVLIIKFLLDSDFNSYTNSLATSVDAARIRFVHLPRVNIDTDLRGRLVGIILDMFCTTVTELADEVGVPSYVFFTSSAAFLGLMLHLQLLQDKQRLDITEFKDSATELDFPSFEKPLPAKVLCSVVLMKKSVRTFLEHAKMMRGTGGNVINTFDELEPHAVASFAGLRPPAVKQQFNAFELVVELGLMVEIKMDYRVNFQMESDVIMTADEIGHGIQKLMGKLVARGDRKCRR